MRKISSQLDARPNVGLLAAYKQSVQDVSRHCDIAQDDIRWWRRSGFKCARAKYCSYKDEQIDPMKRKGFTPLTSNDDLKRAWSEARQLLRDGLSEIEQYGK